MFLRPVPPSSCWNYTPLMTRVARNQRVLKLHPFSLKPLHHPRAHCMGLWPSWLLNISSEGASTPSLDSLFQSMVMHTIKLFLIFKNCASCASGFAQCFLSCARHHQEEPGSIPSTPSFQRLSHYAEVPSKPSLLVWTGLTLPFFVMEMLQTFHHFHCPSLDTPQELHVISSLNLLAVLFPGHTSILCPSWPPGPSPRSCFQAGWDPTCAGAFWVILSQVQDPVFALVELQTVLCPSLQPAKIFLQGCTVLWGMSTPPSFVPSVNVLTIVNMHCDTCMCSAHW